MRKLEIGSQNKRIAPDWETLDIIPGENVDIVADIEKGIDVEDGVYDLVYMSHILEHIPWFDAEGVLKDIFRIVAPGGSLEIYVPDLEKLVRAYLGKQIPDRWLKHNGEKLPIKWFLGRLYAYGENRHDPNWHKGMFDFDYMKLLLLKVGFKKVEKINKPRGYNHGFINLGVKATK